MQMQPTPRPRKKIGLLMDEPIRVAGLRAVFEDTPDLEGISITTAQALADRSFSIVIMGVASDGDSFETIARLRAERPDLKLIVLCAEYDDESIINAIAAGAKGYLDERATPRQVLLAVDVVANGSIWAPRRVLSQVVDRMLLPSQKPLRRHASQFTPREQEVLDQLVKARSNREIAEELGIEERTVKAYLTRLMRKVGVANRIALSIHAAANLLAPGGVDQRKRP